MKYLSVCSGIEAATVAWHPLAWDAVAYSEIDKFPCAVLAHHYPDTPNWGDMTKFEDWPDASIDVLIGGTPCQSFSIAGLRKGLADPRGNLALTYLAIAARYRPKWVVWENVPGILSSNRGRDFGSFVGGLGKLGYGFAYRILDAQYFGVPQRRRRVFVVGYLGDWRRAAAVLFERESLQGHPPPRRETGQDIASTFTARTNGGGGLGADFECGGGLVGALTANGVGTCGADDNQGQAGHLIAHTLRGEGFDASEDGTGRGTPLVVTSFHGSQDPCVSGHITHPAGRNQGLETCIHLSHTNAVRRLLPVECERLQGFSDNYTLVPYRGKPASKCADGPRYKALGNSMAVPVVRWIGERMPMVEGLAALDKSPTCSK